MLPSQINRIIFDTGNVLTCKELRLRTSQTPTDEILQSVNHTLDKWLQTYNPEVVLNNEVKIKNDRHITEISSSERPNLRITLKLFLMAFNSDAVPEAVNLALRHLKLDHVNHVLLSFPNTEFTQEQQGPSWMALEKLVKDGIVTSIGVSDLDANQLRQLYNWSKIKPDVNQVNLESCCVMPEDLTAFAKEKGIQLLTHSDPRVILPADTVPKMLRGLVPDEDSDKWSVDWIVRFSATVKSRGILQSTGYFLCCTKSKGVLHPEQTP